MKMDWLNDPVQEVNQAALQAAVQRQSQLTKPAGSLGRIEEIAITLASLQNRTDPNIDTVHIAIFAADHGVAAENVSAFPQSVTVEMVRNFSTGGAAISVLAKHIGASLEVVNVGTVADPGPLPGVNSKRISNGTANLCREAAMSDNQLMEALLIGREVIEQAQQKNINLFIGGEMGIANTTSASALTCALLEAKPESIVGPGTGLKTKGVTHKVNIVRQALALHQKHLNSPLEILRRLGGFEIAALTGAYIRGAQVGIPILVDGFISSVAALIAVHYQVHTAQWMIFSHTSAEPGHSKILRALDANPLFNLNLRLGEGSGAALAVPQIRLACALHNQMATFTDAKVSEKIADPNDASPHDDHH